MILFPFRTVYLKTSKLRKEIVLNIVTNTYLSDAAYKKTDQNKTFFYGSVNDQGFILQNVSHEKITAFIEGNILGVDEDMYIIMSLWFACNSITAMKTCIEPLRRIRRRFLI